MKQNVSWNVLLRQDVEGELRIVVACEAQDGTVLVEERTDGELTLLTYGALTCVRSVAVASEAVEGLVWALGPGEGGSLEALGAFFAGDDRFLSDLQDVLDAGGVPYTYTVTCGNDHALRRYAE